MKTLSIIVILAAIAGGLYYWSQNFSDKISGGSGAMGYKNISYTIDGQEVKLTNGVSELPAAPGSASVITTRYFGNEVRDDFDGDGRQDVAFLLTQDGGGSGTFYYLAVALKTDTGYTGTNTVYIGDRIAPQTTEFRDGEIIVNYAERRGDEPMTASPSVGVSKYFTVRNGTLYQSIK
jgi:hypothetical protein